MQGIFLPVLIWEFVDGLMTLLTRFYAPAPPIDGDLECFEDLYL